MVKLNNKAKKVLREDVAPLIYPDRQAMPLAFDQSFLAIERVLKMSKRPLRVQIVSDLHLEMPTTQISPLEFSRDAPIVLLAGDISNGKDGVAQAARLFAHANHIIMVAGNHEYWDQGKDIDLINLEIREAAERYSTTNTRFHFLENETVQICVEGIDLRISGATLWTDLDLFGNKPLAELNARNGIPDYKLITGRDGAHFTPKESLERHKCSRRTLMREFIETDFQGPRLVVTHHAPSLRSIAPEYAWYDISPCFASRMDSLLQMGPCLWAHGHTHNSFRYGGGDEAFVVCNPRGYPGDRGEPSNPHYDPQFVVNLVKNADGNWTALPEADLEN